LTWFERSRVLALLAGLVREAKSGAMTDKAAAIGDQAVAAFGDAISTGRSVPEELKERDFDALRGRDDFKRTLAEVAAESVPKAEERD
jgi:hypothetical protein